MLLVVLVLESKVLYCSCPRKHRIHLIPFDQYMEIEKQALMQILGINTNKKKRPKDGGNHDVVAQYDPLVLHTNRSPSGAFNFHAASVKRRFHK